MFQVQVLSGQEERVIQEWSSRNWVTHVGPCILFSIQWEALGRFQARVSSDRMHNLKDYAGCYMENVGKHNNRAIIRMLLQ